MDEPRVKLEEAPGTSDQPVIPTGPSRNNTARVFITVIAEKNGSSAWSMWSDVDDVQ